MADRAEIVRQEMKVTRAAMEKKLESVEAQVREQFIPAAENVRDTIELVTDGVRSTKAAVDDTVESVKRACDVRQHVQQRPWAMVAGAVAVGFAGTKLAQHRLNGESQKAAAPQEAAAHEAPVNGKAAAPVDHEPPSKLSKLADAFAPELSMVKGLAVGVAAGLVRDWVSQASPDHLGGSLKSILENATHRFGGGPAPEREGPRPPQ